MKFLLFIIMITIPGYAAAIKVSNLVEPVYYHTNHTTELQKINKAIAIFGHVSLVGVSGIGKTQLSRKYAKTNEHKYDLIWIFDGNTDLSPQFVQLAQSINKSINNTSQAKISEGINEAKKSTLTYLNQHKKHKFLLIIDNLKLNKNNNAEEFLNWSHNGHIIFCAQEANLLPNILNIPYLSPHASEEVIRRILPDLSNDFITKLSDDLNGYPITIAKSAIFLASNQYITVDEYREHLKESRDDMDAYVSLLISQLRESTKNLLFELVFLNNQNLSKLFIQKLSNKDTFIEDLIDLNRYQILSLKYNDGDMKIFELHDKLKEAIINSMDKKLLLKNLSTTIDKINYLIPKGKNTKQELILADNTMISSLEELLNYAERNKVNIEKILELKKNLMSFYLGMGVQRCQELKEWLLDNKNTILANNSNNHTKAVYSEFLVLIGVYDYFIKADYHSAIKHLHDAEKIIDNLSDYQDLKYLVFSQLAQAYVYDADMEKSSYYIKKARMIDTDVIGLTLDSTLLRYIESKYFLSKGDYSKSLNAINELIEIIKDHPIDYYYAPIYVMKATILNYIGDYQASYKIAKNIYDQEIKDIESGNAGGIRLRVIIELSRAELGLNLIQKSLDHAMQAINIYKNAESRQNIDLNTSSDIDLADAFVAQADALNVTNRTKEAIESYAIAESIYYNKYKKRISSLNEVSVLYLKATLAAYGIGDKYSFNKFKKRHVDKFGVNHFRSKEILKLPDL